MKNILISLSAFSLLILLSTHPAFSSTACEIAVPRYGVIECYNINQWENIPIPLRSIGDESYGSFSCVSNCKLVLLPNVNCGGWGTHWNIKVNEQTVYEESSLDEGTNNQNIQFNRGEELTIRAYCRELLGGKHPIPISSVNVKQEEIMLKEGWAGTKPTSTIPNTEGCTLNMVVDKYRNNADISSFFDPIRNGIVTKPIGTYQNIQNMPTNWKIGDNYIFVKDWQTGVADISLTYDKNNNGYWCGGMTGNRKIYNVKEITSSTGKCYAIPQSVSKSNIECCFPADCSWKGTQYTCNPDTWNCEETRWCDSELDCQQVFGGEICQNKQITSWTCNFNKKWGKHTGTCEKKVVSVPECSSDCTSDEYYDNEEHKCKPRVVLLDCPAGRCCFGGGNYKPKSCSAGMKCCRDSGDVGTCKESCVPVKKTTSSSSKSSRTSTSSTRTPATTGLATSQSSSNPLMQNLTGIIAILVCLFIAYALYKSQKKTVIVTDEEGAPPKVVPSSKRGAFCGKCGSKVKKSAKFCDSCGEKII